MVVCVVNRSGGDLVGLTKAANAILKLTHDPAKDFATKTDGRRDAAILDETMDCANRNPEAQRDLPDVNHETHLWNLDSRQK
jgi:hypothetical protein